MYYDSFCKIFIDADVDYEDLFNKILMFMGGKKEAVNYIVSDWCEIFLKFLILASIIRMLLK